MRPELSRRLAQVGDTPYFQYLKRLGAWPMINNLTAEMDAAETEADLSDDNKALIRAADRSAEIAAERQTDDFMAIAAQVNSEMGTVADEEDEEDEDEDDEG